LAVGFCVLLLHVVIVSGFIIQPRITAPPAINVEVRILPDKVVEEKLQSPPLPLVAPRPAIVAQPPLVVQMAPASPSQAPPAVPPSGTSAGSEPPAPPPQPAPPPRDYLSRLAAYLNTFKDYPYQARRKHEEGTVRLHFIMDRTGRVLSYNIAGSSGSSALDNEALDLIRRADPLPAMPAEYPGNTLNLVVPIIFSLH
jgi:protein TonB